MSYDISHTLHEREEEEELLSTDKGQSVDATSNLDVSSPPGTNGDEDDFLQPEYSPVEPTRFLRKNHHSATAFEIPKTSRRGSASSVDTADLLDHRQATYSTRRDSKMRTESFDNSKGPVSESFLSRRRFSTLGTSESVFTNPFRKDRDFPSKKKTARSQSFNSPSLIERMVKRRGSSSQTPLLQNKLDVMPNYDSLDSVDPSREALLIDIDGLNGIPRRTSLHPRGSFGLHAPESEIIGGSRLSNSQLNESLFFGSEPVSRRDSPASSLRDVCFPIESLEVNSINGRGCNFDLGYLQEFADVEKKELMEIEDHSSVPSIFDQGQESGRTSILGSGPVLTHTFSDIDPEGGRHRPQKVAPWESTSIASKRSESLLHLSRSNLQNLTNRQNSLNSAHDGRHGNSTGAQNRHSQPDIPSSPTPEAENFDNVEYSYMRFTYFREDLDATVHSASISGLLQPKQTFEDLFNPSVYGYSTYQSDSVPSSIAQGDFLSKVADRTSSFSNTIPKNIPTPAVPMSSESSSNPPHKTTKSQPIPGVPSTSAPSSRESMTPVGKGNILSPQIVNAAGPSQPAQGGLENLDPSPFWLDVLNPTEEEMKVLSKTFGIHPLTTEDIFLGETREKVELFRHYYLVCFCSFNIKDEQKKRKDQTEYAEANGISNRNEFRKMKGVSNSSRQKRRKKHHSNELTPLNMYIIVFREGVITFHFSATPHPMNVRRRARLLRDYITVSSDWISYALVDDITDGFAPIIESINDEVSYIEDAILRMHSGMSDSEESSDEDSDNESEKNSTKGSTVSSTLSFFKNRSSKHASSVTTRTEQWKEKGDMLRRIGECRKRVMSVLRLLGSKADVIKGFSKRCNEQSEVAPRSEIGLYLGDIQDHIITMVQSLNHYEKLLARSHSNYLAQINIDMTRVNNDMNDVLSRITVLGTIVLPMNIVTGLWGMNVIVPGQNVDSLTWFWSITLSLFVFAFICFFIARRVYDIA